MDEEEFGFQTEDLAEHDLLIVGQRCRPWRSLSMSCARPSASCSGSMTRTASLASSTMASIVSDLDLLGFGHLAVVARRLWSLAVGRQRMTHRLS